MKILVKTSFRHTFLVIPFHKRQFASIGENNVLIFEWTNDFSNFSETQKFFSEKVYVSRMYSCVKIHSKSYLSRCRSLRLSGVIMRDSIWWNTTRSCHKHYLRKRWLTLLLYIYIDLQNSELFSSFLLNILYFLRIKSILRIRYCKRFSIKQLSMFKMIFHISTIPACQYLVHK